jgi:hypothetical protein
LQQKLFARLFRAYAQFPLAEINLVFPHILVLPMGIVKDAACVRVGYANVASEAIPL